MGGAPPSSRPPGGRPPPPPPPPAPTAWPRLAAALAASRRSGPTHLAGFVEQRTSAGEISRPFLRWLAVEDDDLALEVLRLQEPPPPEPTSPSPPVALALASDSLASFSAEAKEARRRAAQSLGSSSHRVPRAEAARALGRSLAAERILAFLLQSSEEGLERDVRDAVTPPTGPQEDDGTTESLHTSPAVLLQTAEVALREDPRNARLARIRELLLNITW